MILLGFFEEMLDISLFILVAGSACWSPSLGVTGESAALIDLPSSFPLQNKDSDRLNAVLSPINRQASSARRVSRGYKRKRELKETVAQLAKEGEQLDTSNRTSLDVRNNQSCGSIGSLLDASTLLSPEAKGRTSVVQYMHYVKVADRSALFRSVSQCSAVTGYQAAHQTPSDLPWAHPDGVQLRADITDHHDGNVFCNMLIRLHDFLRHNSWILAIELVSEPGSTTVDGSWQCKQFIRGSAGWWLKDGAYGYCWAQGPPQKTFWSSQKLIENQYSEWTGQTDWCLTFWVLVFWKAGVIGNSFLSWC